MGPAAALWEVSLVRVTAHLIELHFPDREDLH